MVIDRHMGTREKADTWVERLNRAYEDSEFTRLRDLANKVDADPAQVSRWLRGENKPGRFYRPRLSRALKTEGIWDA